jgi:xanthine dehydrogenase large subunit
MSVSKPLPHDAAKLHVTGRANYIDDIPVPSNCLHLAFGTATIARGRLTSMDLSAVKSAHGVVAVITADDLPFANDVSPAAHDEPLLCDGQIHYHGQPMFLVVADSHLNARRAARLARVEYAPETPILTIEQALAANSRFEEGPRIYTRGDVDYALPQAEHTLTGSFDIGGQEHFYLEGQAALALPQEDDEMIVHSSTQHPTEIQHKVAEALGLGMHQVRIQTRRMGGGFGGKESQGNALAVACAIAARTTGRPCKMRYDRDDDMIITGKRHDFRITYQVGFDNDGRLLAIDFTHYTRGGWAQDLTLPVADRAMLHADNAYFVPNMRVTSHRLKTNTTSATAFRGFGGPQGMIGIERVMDHVARHLGRDPWDIRRLNFYANANSPTPQDTHYGMPVRDFILDDLCDELINTSDYHKRKTEIAAWNENSPILKRGNRDFTGQIRYILYPDAPEPSGGLGACVPRRQHPYQPRWHRNGSGFVSESGPSRRITIWRRHRGHQNHRNRHGQGAQHIRHGGQFGQ